MNALCEFCCIFASPLVLSLVLSLKAPAVEKDMAHHATETAPVSEHAQSQANGVFAIASDMTKVCCILFIA